MISRMASKYIKKIKFDSREKREEIRRVLRIGFLDFCEKNGVENTLKAYHEYRAVVRSLFGFDLPLARPTKKTEVVETTIDMF